VREDEAANGTPGSGVIVTDGQDCGVVECRLITKIHPASGLNQHTYVVSSNRARVWLVIVTDVQDCRRRARTWSLTKTDSMPLGSLLDRFCDGALLDRFCGVGDESTKAQFKYA
jgi:hypothetical protein